jgi:hypothetical protein
MDFYRLKEIPARTRRDVTYRYPVGLVFLLVVVLAGLLDALCFGVGPAAELPRQMRMAAGFGALATVLLGFVLMGTRLNPRVAWLARVTDDGLVVKFRSPRNHRALSSGDVVAFRLAWDEIAWAIPAGGAEHALGDTHLELKLASDDLLPLKMHLANERGRKKPQRPHFWSLPRRLTPHHPAQLMPEGVLRLEWKVRPGLKRAVETVRGHLTGAAAPAPEGAHAAQSAQRAAKAHAEIPVRSEQEELTRILHLARTGDMMAAFLAAGDAFGVTEEVAEDLVEALAAGQVVPDRPETTSAFLAKAASREVILKKAQRGDFMAVQGALVRDYGFAPGDAADLAGMLTELPPDKGRRRLDEALANRPAPTPRV